MMKVTEAGERNLGLELVDSQQPNEEKWCFQRQRAKVIESCNPAQLYRLQVSWLCLYTCLTRQVAWWKDDAWEGSRKEGGWSTHGERLKWAEQKGKVHLGGQSINTPVNRVVVIRGKGGVQVKHLAFHLSNTVIREPLSQNQETGDGQAGIARPLFGTQWQEDVCGRARWLCEVCTWRYEHRHIWETSWADKELPGYSHPSLPK